jgi:hypothetical protein
VPQKINYPPLLISKGNKKKGNKIGVIKAVKEIPPLESTNVSIDNPTKLT